MRTIDISNTIAAETPTKRQAYPGYFTRCIKQAATVLVAVACGGFLFNVVIGVASGFTSQMHEEVNAARSNETAPKTNTVSQDECQYAMSDANLGRNSRWFEQQHPELWKLLTQQERLAVVAAAVNKQVGAACGVK